MKGKNLLMIAAIAILTGAGCNNDNKKKEQGSEAVAAEKPLTITNYELYPFMLGGVYFFHGYGGPAAVYDRLIKPMVQGQPGDSSFSTTLQSAYSRYFVFPFKPEDDKDGKEAKATLADYWDIHDKAGLEQSLTWLLEEGHQAQYARYRKAIDENGGKDADLSKVDMAKYGFSAKDKDGLEFVKAHYTSFSPAGIKAWDLARFINNICIAYQAGYFVRGEAVAWLQKAPLIARKAYSDWKTYFNDFLLGREFWGGGVTDNEQYKKEVDGLLEGEYSIYQYLSF